MQGESKEIVSNSCLSAILFNYLINDLSGFLWQSKTLPLIYFLFF